MPNSVNKQANAYADLLAKIAKAQSHDDLQDHQSQIIHLAKLHEQEKNDFRNAVLKFIQGYVPTATSWDAIAKDAKLSKEVLKQLKNPDIERSKFEFLFDDVARCLGKTLSSSCREERIDFAMRAFAIPMRFAFLLIYELIVQGAKFDKSKNFNSSEDFKILFSVSSEGTIEGKKVCLVTNESKMKQAAIDCNSSDLVLSVSDYLKFLGVDSTHCDNVSPQGSQQAHKLF